MKKSYVVYLLLVVMLSAFLVMGYVEQTEHINQTETIKNLVTDATLLIQSKGEDAFSDFRQGETKWFHDDTYVFVWRTNGIRVVYPPDPADEGENMSLLLDVNGKAIGQLFINIALSEDGEGWIDYSWPKPGETEPSSKTTYIKAVEVDGQTFLVGSGFYVNLHGNFLAPLHYLSIIGECVIAGLSLFIAFSKKRTFGYGIFLTFVIYVFYDLANLIPLRISDNLLYSMFFVATLSMLWSIILIYKEK